MRSQSSKSHQVQIGQQRALAFRASACSAHLMLGRRSWLLRLGIVCRSIWGGRSSTPVSTFCMSPNQEGHRCATTCGPWSLNRQSGAGNQTTLAPSAKRLALVKRAGLTTACERSHRCRPCHFFFRAALGGFGSSAPVAELAPATAFNRCSNAFSSSSALTCRAASTKRWR